jgi:hypothetical protein
MTSGRQALGSLFSIQSMMIKALQLAAQVTMCTACCVQKGIFPIPIRHETPSSKSIIRPRTLGLATLRLS